MTQTLSVDSDEHVARLFEFAIYWASINDSYVYVYDVHSDEMKLWIQEFKLARLNIQIYFIDLAQQFPFIGIRNVTILVNNFHLIEPNTRAHIVREARERDIKLINTHDLWRTHA